MMNKESIDSLEAAKETLETAAENIYAQIENIVYLQDILLRVKDDNINTQYMQKGIGMFSMFFKELESNADKLEEVKERLFEVGYHDN